MTNDWVEANLALLHQAHPTIDVRVAEGINWVRIPGHPLPEVWAEGEADIAFRITTAAGEAPYGFWARPQLTLRAGGPVNNYTYPATTPWGSDWGQFSFSPSEPWQPKADIRFGPNMLRYACGIADRLAEGA
jgi:hypothetical protein